VDVALPEHVPLAELLPELLRHAGEGLADDGERHGGWVLRRTDGTALQAGQALLHQGVRDGEVLHLVPARTQWPELEYDDVVEAIAEGARRRGVAWSATATRAATLVAGSLSLAVGLFAVLRAGPGWASAPSVALGAAFLLCLAGVVASRGYGDAAVSAALGAWAMPYAFTGAALLVTSGDPVGPFAPVRWLGVPEALAGSAALLLAAVLGAVGVAAGLRVFVAGVSVGLVGTLTALAGLVLPATSAAAIMLSALVCGIGLVPLAAIRFGKLPVPAGLPGGDPGYGTGADAGGSTAGAEPEAGRQRVDRAPVFAAVARSEELLTGMLIGYGLLVTAANLILVTVGGFAGRLLAAVSVAALLARSRLFVAVSQRVPLVAAGLAGAGMLGVVLAGSAGPAGPLGLVAGGLLAALLTVAAGAVWSRRPPSPYLARAVDLLDLAATVSVVPVACAVLGLYARARGLLG
jgi:type VII secretion integral membrane protein EccD